MSSQNERVPVIVLTGGPCGGKTTALSYLRQKLPDYGWEVVVVSEAATEFILAGLRPTEGSLDRLPFQRQLFKHILEKEDRFKEATGSLKCPKKVVICDRGIMDILAYIPIPDFEGLVQENGMRVAELRDGRYDAVIVLRSLAYDKAALYSVANNAARSEDPMQARLLDDRTLEAWTGHPHLRIVDNSWKNGMEGKARRVLQETCRVLGIPVPLEIERKYLVRPKSWDFGSSLRAMGIPYHGAYQHSVIEQVYLDSGNPSVEERVRMRTQQSGPLFYHTIKRPVRSGVRVEEERQISAEEHDRLLLRADPRLAKIRKMRTCFVWKNQYFEFDELRFGDRDREFFLEIELTEEGTEVNIPHDLFESVEDVTGKPEFGNCEIARRFGQKRLDLGG